MISEQMRQLINYLISAEYQSAYLYQAMSAYFNRINLTGMGRWLRLQNEEELGHATRLIDYLTDRNGIVEIRAIPAQPVNYGTPFEAFQRVLAHEQAVTEAYRQAYAAATQAGDFETVAIVQEFLREQTEEVAQAFVIVGRLQQASNNPAAILLLDQELGQRTAPAPAPAQPAAPAAPAD